MDKLKMEELPEPIGNFIIEQKDLCYLQLPDGRYWHYKDVVTMLSRFLKSRFNPTPSSAEVYRAKIKMLEDMKEWAEDSMDKGATGDEILYSHNDFFADMDTWIKKCEEELKALSHSSQPEEVNGEEQDDMRNELLYNVSQNKEMVKMLISKAKSKYTITRK